MTFDPRCVAHDLTAYYYDKGIWTHYVVECLNDFCVFVLEDMKRFRWRHWFVARGYQKR